MTLRNKIAATVPFAHLLGISAKEDDDERKQKADESDDDYAKRMEKLDKEEEDARKAEEDKEKEDARKAEEKEKEDEARRAKGGKKADDGDDDDDEAKDEEEDKEEGKRSGRAKGARRRERARCAAIFNCPAAATHPHVAANLAFNTSMSRSAAIAVLQSVATANPVRATSPNLRERMYAEPTPSAGADGGSAVPAGMSKVAAAIIAAGEKARGETSRR